MSALPRFFFITAIAGFALWLVDAPYPFPLLGILTLGASIGGFLFSTAYVHAFMPFEWRQKIAAFRRMMGMVEVPMNHSGKNPRHV